MPVHIPLRPNPHFAVWGWMTANDGLGSWEIVVDDVGFNDATEIVHHAMKFFTMDACNVSIKESVENIRIRTSEDSTERLGALDRVPTGFNFPPPRVSGSAVCLRSAPRVPMDVDNPPPPSSRQGTQRSAPPAVQKLHKRRRTTTPGPPAPPPPPRSPLRARDGEGNYDISTIGGDEHDMREVAATCPTWTHETVEYVLERGGRPPLVDITGGTALELFCNFRAPNGDLVRNVRVPRSVIAALYRRVA